MSFLRKIVSRQLFLTIVLLGLLVLISFPLTKNWRQKQSIDTEIKELEQQVAELEHKNSSLKQVMDYMKSDQFVEEEARTKLNFKKPGEKVAVIEAQPGEETTSTAVSDIFDLPPAPEAKPEPKFVINLHKWLDYFFAAQAAEK